MLWILAGLAFITSIAMKAWVLMFTSDGLRKNLITTTLNPLFVALITAIAARISWRKEGDGKYILDARIRWFMTIASLIGLLVSIFIAVKAF